MARSLRLPAGQPATIVTVRFDDPAGTRPVALTVAVLRSDMFRVVLQSPHQPLSDGAARSSKKNAHVGLPFRSQYSGTRDKPPAPHTPHTPTREPRSNPIVGISRIGNRVAMMIGRNAARAVAVKSHSAPQISDTTTVDA